MDITNIITHLSHIAISMGYIGIFFFMLIEYASIPIPSELILPFFGISAALGHTSLTLIIVVSTVAALLGSIICYYIGYFGGAPLIEWLKKKSPKLGEALDKLAIWFSKYGKESVLIARVVPVIRTYVSLLAGAEKIKMSIFTFYSTIGILIWNLILILLGYFVGNNMPLIQQILGRYTKITIIVCAIAFIVYMIFKLKKRNKKKNSN